MKQWTLWMCGLVVLVLAIGPVIAAEIGERSEEPKKPKKVQAKAPTDVQGKQSAAKDIKKDRPKSDAKPMPLTSIRDRYYVTLAKECNLTDEQMARIEKVLNDSRAMWAEWVKTNGPRMAEIQQAKKKLRAAGKADSDEHFALTAEQNAYARQQGDMIRARELGVMLVLTPQQREVWAVYTLAQYLKRPLTRLTLTPEQEAKIKEIAAPFCKYKEDPRVVYSPLAPGEPVGPPLNKDVLLKLQEKVQEEVLTDEQRKRLGAKGGRQKG